MKNLRVSQIDDGVGVLVANGILVAAERTFVVEDTVALCLVERHVGTHRFVFAGNLAVELLVLLGSSIVLADGVSFVGFLDTFRQTARTHTE